MQDRVLSQLGLAAKAGKIAAGGFSAEEAVLAVDIHIAQEVGGFGAGVSYGSVAFFIHGDSPFERIEMIR